MPELAPTIEVTPSSGPTVSVTSSGNEAVEVNLSSSVTVEVDIVYGGSGGSGNSGWLGTNKTASPIGGGRVVTLDRATGGIRYVDPTDVTLATGPFGITKSAIAAGASDVIVMVGDISGMAFAHAVGTLLFCGSNGTLVPHSSLPGSLAFELLVGSVSASDELAVNVSLSPILKG